MPPEAVGSNRPCMKSDVFSFGRIMFFVLCEDSPLDGLSRSAVMKALRRNQVAAIKWPATSPPTPACKEIIERCTAAAVVDRPSIAEVASALEAILLENSSAETSEPIDPSTADFHSLVLLAGRRSKEAAAKKRRKRAAPAPPPPAPAAAPVPTLTQLGRRPVEEQCQRMRSGGPLEVVAEEEQFACNEERAECCGRVHDGLELTPEDVRELTVVDTIIRWNVTCPKQQCCKYHTVLAVLAEHVGRLAAGRCKPDYMRAAEGIARNYGQCRGCLLVHPAPLTQCCEYCGQGEDGADNPDRAAGLHGKGQLIVAL
mmetsp:Transcript_12687/g.36447  ORF Transcript_12687/g.36447 Transcript_12687/m.36447 type:complete len:314 (+) Transcript_12687:3-944(+)